MAKVYAHMANAMGAEGAGKIPALAKNAHLEAAEYPIQVVTGGKGAMPWFRGQLSDQQIADVITYVRSNFGNKYKDKVTAAMVAVFGLIGQEFVAAFATAQAAHLAAVGSLAAVHAGTASSMLAGSAAFTATDVVSAAALGR